MKPNDSTHNSQSQEPSSVQTQPARDDVIQAKPLEEAAPQSNEATFQQIPTPPQVNAETEYKTAEPPSTNKSAKVAKDRDSSSLSLVIAIAVIILLLIIGGAVYAYTQSNDTNTTKKTATTSITAPVVASSQAETNCTPLRTNSLTKNNAIASYEGFVKAIKNQNQTCANSLSSAYFINEARQQFSAPNGDWITAQATGTRPIWKDVDQLPTALLASSFTEASYTEPMVSGEKTSSSVPTTGISLNYPVNLSALTGSTNQKWELSISFVTSNGKVFVDSLQEQQVP